MAMTGILTFYKLHYLSVTLLTSKKVQMAYRRYLPDILETSAMFYF